MIDRETHGQTEKNDSTLKSRNKVPQLDSPPRLLAKLL